MSWISFRSVEELLEGRPPGVRGDLLARALVEVPVAAAPLAQALALGTAQRREGHREQDGIAHHRLGIETSRLGERVRIAGWIRVGHEEVADLHGERTVEGRQAARALEGHPSRHGA